MNPTNQSTQEDSNNFNPSDQNPVVIDQDINQIISTPTAHDLTTSHSISQPIQINQTISQDNFQEVTLDSTNQSNSLSTTQSPFPPSPSYSIDLPLNQNQNPKNSIHQEINLPDLHIVSQIPLPLTPASANLKNSTLHQTIPSNSSINNQSQFPTESKSNQSKDRSTTVSSASTVQTNLSNQTSHSHSAVLIISSLQSILDSKESKKNPNLNEATNAALDLFKSNSIIGDKNKPCLTTDQQAQIILKPLKLACQTDSSVLMVTALDCIGKLISYNLFKLSNQNSIINHQENHQDQPDQNSPSSLSPCIELGDQVTTIICDCFVDLSCPEPVQLQIIKALLALVLTPVTPPNQTLQVHQSSLLRAVRTVYNIFLLSKSPTNQAVAQGALTQIVGHVFGRIELTSEPFLKILTPNQNGTNSQTLHQSSQIDSPNSTLHQKSKSPQNQINHDPHPESPTKHLSPTSTDQNDLKQKGGQSVKEDPQVTLESFEKRNSFDGVSDRDGLGNAGLMNLQEYYAKDAFLVFRALCKLSMKPIPADSEKDLKSHAMRSKLLSLHLILSILNTNLAVFIDPNVVIISSTTRDQTPFIQAIKQYLCLSLSRNAISSVLSVFELSCEIFWKVLSGMRTKLKKEIEVLLNEIFLPILEMRNSTVKQKSILLTALGRLFHDPQALVEVYLNYDCDRTSLGNIYERFMNIVSKLVTTQYTTSTTTSQSVELVGSPNAPGIGHLNNNISSALAASIPPSLSTTSMTQGMADSTSYSHQSVEGQLKRQSLECLVAALQSLVAWAGKGTISSNASNSLAIPSGLGNRASSSHQRSARPSTSSISFSEADPQSQETPAITKPSTGAETNLTSDREPNDDPSRFQTAKNQKTTLIEGIKQFNFKPKRGIKFLTANGFIRSSKPRDVARFLLKADGLSKAMIGEYLGEGDPDNVETMHAFIDFMDFTNMKFTEAMRNFLQAFRLPGEAQKIDRFMLKFAERYYQGNPETLANAETAYVLAFSIIMLNTDAHSPQVKNRMTKKEFLRNNRGINQGSDLPEEYLSALYDEIIADEIRMKDEVEAAIGVQHVPTGLAGSIATVGRDLQKEAYVLQSTGMANKTEILFRTLSKGQRQRNSNISDQFFEASHFEHVRPMFQVVWMPLLAGLSDPLQNSDQLDMITLSLNGFKQAIKIVCLFDLELERNAFVTTLAKFTFLNNLGEMKPKNVEAIKTLLDVAMIDGNYLKTSWKEVLACVSQLERFQLISQGVDIGTESQLRRRSSTSKTLTKSKNIKPSDEVTGAAGASHITYAADMVFSSSSSLSGTAIVDFVKALSTVSWEEIQASGLSGNPRTFCLQKLVEISYYNMGRIRLEWFQIWSILGEHFNQVCCHSNPNVSFFALDSLRQLAMRFLEKEELTNFKFQKDFLKPFEHTMIHSSNLDAKDMVLQCLNQMISARVENLRSGWRTMFGVFSAASKVPTERVPTLAFELVQRINRDHFNVVVAYGSFADLTVCITDFCKVPQFQKLSLNGIEMLKNLIPAMLNCPECPLNQSSTERSPQDAVPLDDLMIKYWFPILFSFYDVTMNGEDLEVRKRALDYLFETLKNYGNSFPDEFWDSISKEVLFPIFAILRSRSDVSRFSAHEDMSVWLSTTMIQALRNLVDLYTFYFGTLGRSLDRLLDLLCECICQENDTLARIGTSCLQQLLEKNVHKLDDERWDKVVSAFLNLFRTTTAYQLFDANLRQPGIESGEGGEQNLSPMADKQFVTPVLPTATNPERLAVVGSEMSMTNAERKRVFRQVIVKCVLQLLLIETTNELLNNNEVYERIPPAALLRLLAEVDKSYRLAKRFNEDKELRMGLWKVGFMKQLPNLLKQESSSAVTLVQVLLRLYKDERPDHVAKRTETVQAFVPLGLDVIRAYVTLDPESQSRNITAWTPVVIEVLQGFCILEKEIFSNHLNLIYPLLLNLLLLKHDSPNSNQDLSQDLNYQMKIQLEKCFFKIGIESLNLELN
ncbi:hypothetical protein O181_007862 [Austropuccinia psidii MF-1]|uniref:SEC7 domain-containing protein n=1 Tax=Austropuccinia psidii MF-1 TaxID=1389203 RepID=A0A9Q3GIW8_9BASI|nr:hypothetical protein [Austropuccinia psidii MF-1]